MRKICVLTILLILFSASGFQAQTKRKTKYKRSVLTKSKTKKKKAPKIISLGVINGRAINLVRPQFPAAAKFVKVRGTVTVSILIDEEGKVIEAEATSGHILLRAGSVSAALKSIFMPVTFGGIPVRVRGVILYNYVLDTFNWLEIGNDFGQYSFTQKLPPGFEEVKQMYEQFLSADRENGLQIYQTLQAMIESKLADNKKNLWLFQLGVFLRTFRVDNPDGEDWKNDITELKTMLANSPENVSPMLISNLKNLLYLAENPDLDTYDSVYESKIYKQLQNIQINLPMFGD